MKAVFISYNQALTDGLLLSLTNYKYEDSRNGLWSTGLEPWMENPEWELIPGRR